MTESIYTQHEIPEVINGVGYATRVTGSCPDAIVVDAMAQALGAYVELDDLVAAASKCISQHTGAEAGIVTCGAGAALSLAAAACLAGNDPDVMDQLPDTTDLTQRNIIYPTPGAFDYDHAVRLSGAKLDLIDYGGDDALQRIDRAVDVHTAAIGYVWHRVGQRPEVDEVARLAKQRELPLIVDAAMSLPPMDNLRSFIEAGADLVALSGGKHLGGPQASGLLFGREELIRSAWLQMVDMDVRPDTWSLHAWIASEWIDRPPRHGIGRSMKVGKEAILGVMTALEHYAQRDHASELQIWHRRIDQLYKGLAAVSDLRLERLFPAPNGQPWPVLKISHEAMGSIIRALREYRPRILFAEDEADFHKAYIFPMCLRDEEISIIVEAFNGVLATTGKG